MKYKYAIVEEESDDEFILRNNPENSSKAIRAFGSISCDSVKTELFKIKDNADKDTEALSFWWNPKVKDSETVHESSKDITELDGHDKFMISQIAYIHSSGWILWQKN